MKDFRSLLVCEKSHKLALAMYKVTSSFPNEELYGLTSQIRRASSSIAINIAEGCEEEVMQILLVFYKCHLVLLVKQNIC